MEKIGQNNDENIMGTGEYAVTGIPDSVADRCLWHRHRWFYLQRSAAGWKDLCPCLLSDCGGREEGRSSMISMYFSA